MNFYLKSLCRPRAGMGKILLVMKLIVILLTTAILQVSASSFGQSVTLKQNNAKLTSVLDQIRKQTGYDFFYSQAMMENAKPISVNLNKVDIKEALEICFRDQPLSYTIDNKIVTIKEKEKSFLENVIARFQAIDVRGKVVDSLGNGLAGVTVSVKPGKNSTSTGADGDFILRNVPEESMLIVSYLGYIRREILINKEYNFIELQQSTSKLDEVQIQAYGLTSRRLSTGNIISVKASEIEKQPINNPLYALQGRVTGLQIIPTTGLAGGAVTLQVRGKNTIDMFRETPPLVVVDGLPVTNNIGGLGFSGLNQISSLSFINPRDIESIDILKDADATSIYGSRGANGVILITTKKGKAGTFKIEFDGRTGFEDIASKVELLNTQDFLTIRKEAYANSNIDYKTLTPSLSNYDLTFWDQNRYTDWQKELLGGRATNSNIQGFASGGNANFQFILGGNYANENTVFPGKTSDQKGGARISVTGISNNQKFKATLSSSYLSNRNTLPGIDFTQNALYLQPNAPALYDAEGNLNWELRDANKTWDNPYSYLARSYEASIGNLVASSTVSYNLIPSLTLSTSLGYNKLNGEAFRKTNPFAGRAPQDLSIDASSSFNTNESRSLSIEPQVVYTKKIGSHGFNFLLGASIQNSEFKDQVIDAIGFKSDALLRNLEAASSYTLRNTSSQYRYAAIFTRLNYNYRDRYILNVSARRDGSSRFGPGKRFGNFGSIAGAWIFSEENILKENVPYLSFGKLRGSYGSSGNDGIGDYMYLEKYEAINDIDDPYQGTKGYSTLGYVNANYSWEVTKKFELGLELGFIGDRILLSGSYFQNRSDNQLIAVPYSSVAGIGGVLSNLPALIQNSGIEAILNTTNIINAHFSWKTSINLTSNQNKLLKYPDLETSAYYRSILGRPFFGERQVYNSGNVDPVNGKYQFVLTNGQLSYDAYDGNSIDYGAYSRVYTQPRYYGGITNSLSYKGFNLDFLFQFTRQQGISPLADYRTIAGISRNLPVEFLKRWSRPGDLSSIQKIYYRKPDDYSLAADYAVSSNLAYSDASFIRLKNLSISYQLPSTILKNWNISNLKFYLLGQNLAAITKYRGFDPETQSMTSLPPLRVFTLGGQITF